MSQGAMEPMNELTLDLLRDRQHSGGLGTSRNGVWYNVKQTIFVASRYEHGSWRQLQTRDHVCAVASEDDEPSVGIQETADRANGGSKLGNQKHVVARESMVPC